MRRRGSIRRGIRTSLVGAAIATAAGSLVAPATAHAATTAAGALDPTFGSGGTTVTEPGATPTGVAVVPDGLSHAGSVLVSAGYQPPTGGTQFQVARFTSTGALDGSFGGSGFVSPFAGSAKAVTVVPNGARAGDVVAVGYEAVAIATCKGQEPVVVEYSPTGTFLWGRTVDCTVYTPPAQSQYGGGEFNAVAIDESGNIVAAGDAATSSGSQRTLVVRLTPTGNLDADSVGHTGFATTGVAVSTGGGAASVANAVAVVPSSSGASDASDVVTAGFTTASGTQSLSLTAYKSDGTADALFGSAGSAVYSGASSAASGLVALPDGNLVAGGSIVANGSPTFLLTEYKPDGTLNPSFNGSGVVQGSPAVNPVEQINALAYQPFGNLLVAAGVEGTGQSQQMVVAQYNASNGAVNGSFGTGGAAVRSFSPQHSNALGVAVQSDGKTVAAGLAPVVNAVTGIGVVRFQGPQLSVGPGPTLKVTANGPVTVSFPASINEPLPADVTATFCATGGASVAGGTPCGSTVIPHGTTNFVVTAVFNVNTLPGNATSFDVVSQSGNGLTGGVAARATIQHLLPPPPYKGYWLVAADGGIFNYGTTRFFGSTGGVRLNQPIVGMAATPDGRGYWLVARDGGIFAFGDAHFYGSTGGITLNKPIVGMARTIDGKGYWLVASDGGIFAFGDARFFGSTGGIRLNQPIVGMAATPDSRGYYLVASDGGIFAFGDARFFGSTGGIRLNQPIVGMTTYPGAGGYWMVASDGGIFSFGAAGFHGSTGGIRLNKPVVGMAATPTGAGYWLVATDGGIFSFGDARFFGSTGGVTLAQPIVGMAG